MICVHTVHFTLQKVLVDMVVFFPPVYLVDICVTATRTLRGTAML